MIEVVSGCHAFDWTMLKTTIVLVFHRSEQSKNHYGIAIENHLVWSNLNSLPSIPVNILYELSFHDRGSLRMSRLRLDDA